MRSRVAAGPVGGVLEIARAFVHRDVGVDADRSGPLGLAVLGGLDHDDALIDQQLAARALNFDKTRNGYLHRGLIGHGARIVSSGP